MQLLSLVSSDLLNMLLKKNCSKIHGNVQDLIEKEKDINNGNPGICGAHHYFLINTCHLELKTDMLFESSAL